jgi:putative Ca2+/H+ antiporter (TMEM165/GDT1 family)
METNLFHHGADWALFISTFGLIFLAELPDKTAVAVLIMSSQRHPFGVYVGVCAAYVVQNIVAVLFGSIFGLLPPEIIHMASGVLFIIFAFLMWFKRDEKKEEAGQKDSRANFTKTAWAAFVVIFIAEWGDLTQLSTATLVAQSRHPVVVFLASTLALWVVSGIFVIIGHHAKRFIQPHILKIIAAIAFAVVGILLLSGFWDK